MLAGVILERIRNNTKPFSLGAEELIRLKKAGVTSNVMLMMIKPTATPAAKDSLAAAPAADTKLESGVCARKGEEWIALEPETVQG